MPLFESESLVLTSYNLSEADKIVVFFTRDHGIVRGVAKGAKRLKSRFGSTLELFSAVKLTYFQKEDRELASVQNVELTRSRFGWAGTPESLHSLSYLAELLIALLPPHDPDETIFRMVSACVDAASGDDANLPGLRLYFELWMLRLSGYLPTWSTCGSCGRGLQDEVHAYLRHDLHIICSSCKGIRSMPSVGKEHRELFESVQRIAPSDFAKKSLNSRDAVIELSELVRKLIIQAVGRDLYSDRPAVNYN